MRAGVLKERIAIEREAVTVDAAGTERSTWTVLFSLKAQLVQSSAVETLRAYGEGASSTLLFRMRRRDGITTADRVLHKGRALGIVEVREIGRRIVELVCKAPA